MATRTVRTVAVRTVTANAVEQTNVKASTNSASTGSYAKTEFLPIDGELAGRNLADRGLVDKALEAGALTDKAKADRVLTGKALTDTALADGTAADNLLADRPPAVPGFQLGQIRVWTPLVLAPMAGVTDMSFRRLCRRFAEVGLFADSLEANAVTRSAVVAADVLENREIAGITPHCDAPGGLFVYEMVTAKAICENNQTSLSMVRSDPMERVRSIQLYGVNSDALSRATRFLLEYDLADQIDLNFGCPVPKVMRRGGGSAVPWKTDLFREIIRAVVGASQQVTGGVVPVTIKMRIGIDDDHVTMFDAAKIAEDEGVAAIGLHARTAAQYYSGRARWSWIADLVQKSSVPILGNGDVFSANDAVSMLRQTGCAGVTVGRGCQGRPWLFAQIAAGLAGKPIPADPNLSQVVDIINLHARWMVQDLGDELLAMRHMRKHIGWYLRGFAVGGQMRSQLSLVKTAVELEELLAQLDLDQEFPIVSKGQRGRAGNERQPHVPYGWLESRTLSKSDRANLHLADLDGGSGG